MRYLSLGEVLDLYEKIMQQTGGSFGIRDLNALKSALAQPRMTFAGTELYPKIAEKASALAFSLIQNHPFVDGNKRIGHAAMEVFLILNGYEFNATVDELEQVILAVASSNMSRADLEAWVRQHLKEKK
jgi:death on curing protein